MFWVVSLIHQRPTWQQRQRLPPPRHQWWLVMSTKHLQFNKQSHRPIVDMLTRTRTGRTQRATKISIPDYIETMGVDHGRRGDTSPLQNTLKSVFGPGSAPDPARGALNAPPDPLVGWRGGNPSPYPTPVGTNPPSALAMRPPEFQPDLRLWLRWVTQTIPHLCLSKAIGLLYLYIVGVMVIIRVSYRYGYTTGQVRSINNRADINACCVWSNSLCKWGLSPPLLTYLQKWQQVL